jgi:L-ribulose-5-phosphate 3-epimerase
MSNKIGVMQGRLVPKYQGRYQAFPVGMWQDEFKVAQEYGLDLIEFILDFNSAKENPILKEGGIEEIQTVIDKTGVTVETICADYFMTAPIHSKDNSVAEQSLKILGQLLTMAEQLRVTDIVIPCVDNSSLKDTKAIKRFVVKARTILERLENKQINLSLETDLAPQPLIELLDKFDSDRITVSYDIGNSASLGYDPHEEFAAYGEIISHLHVKDRILGGGSVILGTGDANISGVFELVEQYNFQGPIIFEAYRDDNGVKVFQEQLEWFHNNIDL